MGYLSSALRSLINLFQLSLPMQLRANLPDKPDPNEMRRVSTKLKTRSKKKEKFPMNNIEHMQKQKVEKGCLL